MIESAQIKSSSSPSLEFNPTEFFASDIWTAENLGLRVSPGNMESKLYFHRIKQQWLKDLVKKYIFYRSINLQFSSLCRNLKALKNFGLFLAKFLPELINANQINEKTLTEYYIYLKQKKFKPSHLKKELITLKVFLDVGNTQDWFNVSYRFLNDWIATANRDIKVIPRFIPNDVLQQLNQHLEALPEPVQRMVLVIQECGLRVSELVGLNFNCLQEDAKGGWFIKFIRWKMKKEDIIPISNELAGIIKAQQNYIIKALGQDYKYLFCTTSKYFNNEDLANFNPQPIIMLSPRFNQYLNWLAKKFEIRDSSQEIWHFQSHQFRHTVGTKMINNNVPHHIIQRYLGHSSPAMTSVYARIMDSTLKREIKNYHSKVVNISGQVMESKFPELDNDTELQWMKKQVLGEVLAHGYCALPAHLDCSKGNACLQCGDFRTTKEFLDKHKEHQERTRKALEVATNNNWKRQVQINEEVLSNLNKIINELEKDL
ncbi:tyrosine-type recombinase/integrase [Nodularia sp. UHCC 0506]|uniref:tyrosine-type recombinase/integrase n=1 Tax=Nodularia sp. UHCC 0506 TaxID=3110243 RepID=UPI002B21E0B8|nr:tyrosine-type recombinase/integrase [Nodularia sp. UHCC 0506]MEA5516958.1 tyrosine-type recombinase/integrase [Nodularia sp. UHCC 0506]